MSQNSHITKRMLITSLTISLLVAVASLSGLLTEGPYSLETTNWRLQARGQDIGNLIGLVVFLISAINAAKGSWKSYLVWVGILLYFIYAYIVYSFAVHFNQLFLVYVAILGICMYTLIASLSTKQDERAYPVDWRRNFASFTLIGTGLLFGFLWLGEVIPALITGETPQSLKDAGLWVNPIHVLDLSAVLPGFVITGLMALKNKGWALFFTAPWLTFSVIMGSSIVAAMILMELNNFPNTLPPAIMVSLVVLISLFSLIKFLKRIGEA